MDVNDPCKYDAQSSGPVATLRISDADVTHGLQARIHLLARRACMMLEK